MRNRQVRRRAGERGYVLMIYTLMLFFVIVPMLGLAIDAGILYTIKAKLQTAVDGAALAASRSLNSGETIASQESAAGTFATNVFHANFPNEWLGVTPVNDPTISWANSTASTAVIDVTATVPAPTWFMRVFNIPTVNVAATSEATRRNVAIMLVIDRSSSLELSGSCPSLISGAQLFVNSFSNNRDAIGLTTFGTYYNNDFPISTDFQDNSNGGKDSLSSVVLPKLVCAGFTNSGSAISYAWSKLKAYDAPGALNVILLFTDGQPNTMTFGPAFGTGSAAVLPLSTSPKSTCTLVSGATGLSGVIAGDKDYGIWGGIFMATNTTYPVASSGDFGVANEIGTGQGRSGSTCNSFKNSPTGFTTTAPLGNDIGNLPSTDAWGNSINSTWAGGASSGTDSSGNSYQFPATVSLSGGSEWTLTNLNNAGVNALDNAAQNIRVDAANNSFPLVIYTIGLGNATGGVPDELLRRVANDPTSAVYQTSYPTGMYIEAPSTATLSQAFTTIADDIMRISK